MTAVPDRRSRRAVRRSTGRATLGLAAGVVLLAAPGRAAGAQRAPRAQSAATICPSGSVIVPGNVAANAVGTSVGITYFSGRSRDGDDAHLAAAITNELARQLLSARFPNAGTRPGDAGQGLLTVKLSNGGEFADVDLSMTGSVYRSDTLLQTSVRVNRTSDGALLWSGSRTRSILELPILARLIAQEIVKRLGAQLTTPAALGIGERSTEVYELILRGTYQTARYSPDDLLEAIGYFDRALALDPKSVHARDLRSAAQLRLLTWGGTGNAMEAGLIGQGMLRRITDRDRDESERLVEEADEELRNGEYSHACKLLNAAINSDTRSAPAYTLRSLIRARAGQAREAFADAEIVTQLGRPLWGSVLRALTMQRMGDVTKALHEARFLADARRRQQGPLAFWDARLLATALAQTGDYTGAREMLARVNPQDPRLVWTLSDPLLQPPAPAPAPADKRALRRPR